MTARRVLVLGASGYIGSNLVPRLVRRGLRVRASARSREVLEARGWAEVECVAADALQLSSLEPALKDIDVAWYLVHSMAAGRDFAKRDLDAADNFARAAARAGVRRIVYLGGLVPPEADSEHLLSRQETGIRLRAGPVPVTEIRAGIIVGPGSAAFEVMRDLVYHLPVMVTPRWVRSRQAPIALDNLLEYLVRVPDLQAAAGQVYDAGGPDLLGYADMMRQLAEVVGKRPLIVPVPVLSPGLSSYWLGLTTAVPTQVARALIGGLTHDILAADGRLRDLVPQRLLSFKEAVSAALEIEARNAAAARWTEGAMVFRDFRPDFAFYAKRASGTAVSRATVQAAWEQVQAIGGRNRYYAMNALWTLRELLDWLAGGPGLNRGRRHPTELRLGDGVDSWRVIGLDPPRSLTLRFGMKAPGAGVMELVVAPEAGGHTRVTVTAYWHPAGFRGLLYWYAMAPAHGFIFRAMTRAITSRAERGHSAAVFPVTRSVDLNGRPISLPADFPAPFSLVFVAFEMRQQADVDSWRPFVERARRRRPSLGVFELPTIARGYRLMQFVIDNGMRSGIPDRETRAATVTLYTDVPAFMRAIGVQSSKVIAVLVVTPAGEILARSSGRFSEAAAAPVEKALDTGD